MNLKELCDTPPWEWPADAGEKIREVLADQRAEIPDRLIAAGLAGNIVAMSDELAAAMLAVLRSVDEPEELRARVAISFGPVLEQGDMDGFDDPEAVPISRKTYRSIRQSLKELYFDESVPKEVRRRIMEASVRAPASWHREAIRSIYESGDREWMLTAVFAMRWVKGFSEQILQALNNGDPEIHGEAVQAAGAWRLAEAWPHIASLVRDPKTPKELLLAAIGAVADLRPREAPEVLAHLADSGDEEIAEAAKEAMFEANPFVDEDDDEDFGGKWLN